MVPVKLQHLLLATGLFIIAGSLWVFATVDARGKDAGAEIRTAAREFDEAQLRKDREALDRFLAPDMRFIRGSGQIQDREAFIGAFTDPDTTFSSFSIRNRRFMTLGNDAAIVSAQATIRGTSGSEPFEEHIHYADLFARRNGKLQVVHVQVTPLARP